MYFGILEGIRNEYILLSFPKFRIIIAYFKLVINIQKPQYLQSLQYHINIEFLGPDELVMVYPRAQTYDICSLFGEGARTQCLGN